MKKCTKDAILAKMKKAIKAIAIAQNAIYTRSKEETGIESRNFLFISHESAEQAIHSLRERMKDEDPE